MKVTSTFIQGLKKIQALRPTISHQVIIRYGLLTLILIIAFSIRMLPARWGYYLNEYDPYYQYRQTKYIVENGLFGEKGYLSWHDYLSWWPWGNEIRNHAYPGLPLTAASLFITLKILGIPIISSTQLHPVFSDPVYNFCVIFPVLMGTLSCLAIYYLGKDLGGVEVGLFSALFLALDSSHIARTSLGFFDDETVGILGIIVYIVFFLRSIDPGKPRKISMLYSVAAGLMLGYLCISWGASRYPLVMTALFAFVLLIIGRYTSRLLLSYGITFLLALSITASVPYTGVDFLLLTEVLPVYGIFSLLSLAEIIRRLRTTRSRLILGVIIIGAATGLIFLLWSRGMMGWLEAKFLSVILPSTRFQHAIIVSVAEHSTSAWGTFYYNFGIAMLFLPIGLFFAAIMGTNLGIFMTIYGLTSVYFASSMIRLTIMMSPAVSVLWALAIVRIARPVASILRERPTPKKKALMGLAFSKEAAAGVLVLLLLMLTLNYVLGTDFVAGPYAHGPRVYVQAYTPTSLAAAGMVVKPEGIARDWIDALAWMRENLPPSPSRPGEPGTVVASWWDYGYWITAIANKTSLADNGTWNWTQIEQIGLMFMSNETVALEILRKYNVTHVVVFTTFNTQGQMVMAGGDEGKWTWMAKIAGLNDTDFGNYTLGWDYIDADKNGRLTLYPYGSDYTVANIKGQDSVLYKMMTYGREMTIQGYSSIMLEYFEKAYFSQKPGSPNPAPGTSYVPLVCIYEVKYPVMTVRLSQNSGTAGAQVTVSGTLENIGAQFKIFWDYVGDWDGRGGLIAEGYAKGYKYSANVTIPSAHEGEHYIIVRDEVSGLESRVGFTLTRLTGSE
ncbi:MAG: STT3 domain-containing protein [Nitrososphaerota archaeon]|nr:hypothetical protein [Candidatus Bathyarchaeota archaeon]MDW8049041.1 STT3 domain-containing protein [Nitrososphaerota archaeon]